VDPRRPIAALVGMLALPLLATGCGNRITTEITGATGASLDHSGSPRLSLAVCSGSVGFIELYGPHRGNENTPQKPIGVWHPKKPVTADAVLNLESPGPSWTVELDPGRLKPNVPYTALGGSSTADEEISQVDFRLERLKRLPANQVRYYDVKSVRADAFHATVCQ
jgi:hypothetical protein